jgi:hypothetical protein
MQKTAFALGTALLTLFVGCDDTPTPEVAGKVVLAEIFLMQDVTHVIDTGHDGNDSITSNDEWDVACWGSDLVGLHLLNIPKSKGPSYKAGFYEFTVTAYADGRIPPDKINVSAMVDIAYYAGVCPVTYTKLSNEPFDAEILVSTCELNKPTDDYRGRIESAAFRMRSCEPAP